jgi:Carboxypeptidase regulatory-like domain/TonB dependent receptor/TonB-dependent Receptor Plug Domain
MKKNVFAALALALLAALPALAQGLPTGTLNGRVTDADGAVLAGVTVTASSDALQGTRSVTTGASGDYNIPLLPPGEYTVTFELEGFDTGQRTVRMAAAQTTSLSHELTIGALTETITATGSLETISTQPQVATTFTKEVVESLPMERNVREVVLLTPGAAATGPSNQGTNPAIVISGAQSYENLFLVNGVVINENLRGQPFNLFIEDAIEETTTSTAGISAEYGRFAGGVVNTITKSGGNDFHGSLRAALTNQDWVSKTPLTTVRTDKVNQRYEGTLGGRIVRDKLWFFLAGRDFEDLRTSQTTLTNVPFDAGTEQQRYEGKLTLSPFQGHRAVATYLEIAEDELGNFFGNILDTRSINNRSLPQELLALNYTGVWTANFFTEAQYSERNFTFENSGSKFTDIINGTLVVDGPSGRRYWSPTFCGVCLPEERNNENLLLKASYFLSSEAAGSHELIAGYDSFNDIRQADNHQSGSDYRIITTGTIVQGTNVFPVLTSGNANTYIQWNPIAITSRGTDFQTESLFLNDRWRLNDKLSFNIGVRYDSNDGKNSQGQTTASDSKITPRLSATYDLKGDGDWIFNASYGEYVATIANNQADATSAAGNPATFQFFYRGPSINTVAGAPLVPTDAALATIFAWFDSVGGTANTNNLALLRAVDIPGGTTRIAGGSIESPSTTEISVGFSKLLGSRGQVRADYVRRDGKDFYFDRRDRSTGRVITGTGASADLSLIENNDSLLERTYDGLHTQFRYRFGNRVDIGGNYTYSKTEGNVDGETFANGPVRASVGNYPEYKEERWNNPGGYLGSDQRHRAGIYGVFSLLRSDRQNLSVSLLQRYATGTPFGAIGTVASRNFVTNPGYATPPASVTYFFTSRDAFRTDDITSTDLSVNYSFFMNAFGQQFELFLQPEVLNVFDEQGVIFVDTTVGTVLSAGTLGAGLQAFNPFTTTPVEGVHWRRGPNFGKATNATNFQTPRTYRVSLGFRF